MKQEIAIKYCNGIMLPIESIEDNPGYSLAFVSEMMAYGYIPTEALATKLSELSKDSIVKLHNEILPILKKSVGAHVKHKPFYPNFPKQVMEASDWELYKNALAHYWTFGRWTPNFTIEDRPVAFEDVKFKELDVVTEEDLDNVFTQILQSADSISESAKKVVEWFVTSGRTLNVPERIPFKENVCLVAGIFAKQGVWHSGLIKDTTDVLRIATYMSDGDISLAENTKFKSLPRKIRKVLISDLERVAKEEDFVMHRGKWIKLLHSLHVGEYSDKLYKLAKKLRENEKIATFNGKVEAAFDVADVKGAIKLLKTRPGIFARRIIDLIYKDVHDNAGIVDAFATVVDDVPVRNLTQLWGAVKVRDDVLKKRVVFPKGVVQKAYVLRNEVARLAPEVRDHLLQVITDSLVKRFADMDELGSVYIDPALYECPLPTAMRSASEGLKEVARGTRMPIGDKDTLRFFIYWKGQDIDLSASFHDEEFNLVEHISYTNLRSSKYKAAHSGDITYAPNGASEFIDVDIPSVLAYRSDIRYVVMNVYVFSGPNFSEHEECFAGWMTREKPNSNEIYEPKTVQQKIDLRTTSRNAIPVIFDLHERKAIWADIATSTRSSFGRSYGFSRSGNNIENNKATTEDMVEAFVSLDNKITLGELFELHAKARGTIVEEKDEADFVFGLDDGNVTPYNITEINAEYL